MTLGGLGRGLTFAGGPDDDARLQLAIRVLDDHLARQTRDLVELLAHGDASMMSWYSTRR